MKKPLLKTLGLVLCSSVLLTGCYNGWDTEGRKSSSITSESESSSSSETPIPVDPEDFQVDLTYPLEENEINHISPDQLKEMFLDSTGGTISYATMKREFGEYFLDFIASHNHMTDKEFKFFLSTLWNLVSSTSENDDNMSYRFVYDIMYAIAYINADNLFQTMQEIANDEVAFGYFMTVIFNKDPAEHDFINADYVLNGSNSYIHERAEIEKRYMGVGAFAANPEDFSSFSWEGIYKIVTSNDSNVFIRFLHRFFRSMIRHLDMPEIGFIIYNTFLNGADINEQSFEECNDYIASSPESMLRFIHHIGAWFKEVNVTGSTFGVAYPAFKETFRISLYQTFYYEEAAIIETNWLKEQRDFVEEFFETLNPEGLRALIKFIGLVGENMTLDQMYAFMGQENEDGVVPSGQLVIDLYNKQFGMLKGSEKTGMQEAAAAFGIDFNELIEEFKKVMGEPQEGPQGLYRESDHGDDEQKTLQDVFNEYVAAKAGEKFSFREPTVFSKYRRYYNKLIIKQGVPFTANDFDKYLHSNSTACIGIDKSYLNNNQNNSRADDVGDYYYESSDDNGTYKGRTLRSLVNEFDTDVCGVHEIDFTMQATFTTWAWDETTSESVPTNHVFELNLTLPYYVVPNNVNVIFGGVNNNGLYKNGQYISTGRDAADSNGNRAVYDWDVLYIEKGVNYVANEISMRLHSDYDETVYNDELKRFVSYRNKNVAYESTEAIFDISELKNEELGTNYAYKQVNFINYDTSELIGSTYVCFKYMVVDKLPEYSSSDYDTPVK